MGSRARLRRLGRLRRGRRGRQGRMAHASFAPARVRPGSRVRAWQALEGRSNNSHIIDILL